MKVIVKLKRCPRCHGTGRQKPCMRCDASGLIVPEGNLRICPDCRGQCYTGAMTGGYTCTVCNGEGFLPRRQPIFKDLAYNTVLRCPSVPPRYNIPDTYTAGGQAFLIDEKTNRWIVECLVCLQVHFIEEVMP